MPLRKMSPLTGSSPKESGMRSAMAVTGPMPGNTPTSVPIRTPQKAKMRLATVKASPKPSASLESISAIVFPLAQDPGGQLHAEHVDEDRVHHHREDDGVHQVAYPAVAIQVRGRCQHEQERRECVAERHEDQYVREQEQRDHPELAQVLGRRVAARGTRRGVAHGPTFEIPPDGKRQGCRGEGDADGYRDRLGAYRRVLEGALRYREGRRQVAGGEHEHEAASD